ncbi:hypothetical protein ABIE13_003516 [Ottowia thiooxydans]|uniref:Uncharacterized protein n=1 Tax=Ottowia thiooxydans TaxID=219182 RepID=A0ABV2QCQ5_9BURK
MVFESTVLHDGVDMVCPTHYKMMKNRLTTRTKVQQISCQNRTFTPKVPCILRKYSHTTIGKNLSKKYVTNMPFPSVRYDVYLLKGAELVNSIV